MAIQYQNFRVYPFLKAQGAETLSPTQRIFETERVTKYLGDRTA